MESLNLPILGLAGVLAALIGVTVWALALRARLRTIGGELLASRATGFALVELARGGVFFLDRQHRVSGDVSSRLTALLKRTCLPGAHFSELLFGVVDEGTRQRTLAHLDILWETPPSASTDALPHPLQRIAWSEQLVQFNFSRLIVDGQVQRLVVSVEPVQRSVGEQPVLEQTITRTTEAERTADTRDRRLTDLLGDVISISPAKLDGFLTSARARIGQVRAVLRMPSRTTAAFREKLEVILEQISGIRLEAAQLPLTSATSRAERFEQSLTELRDREQLSGNDFLPLAVKLDDLFSHLALLGEVLARLREWQPAPPQVAAAPAVEAAVNPTQIAASSTTTWANAATTNRSAAPSHLLANLSTWTERLAAEHGKKVSLVTIGVEEVPATYRSLVDDLLKHLIPNALTHGIETPQERLDSGKSEVGTIAVQFSDHGPRGYELSIQDDGRGLDHDEIRKIAVARGMLSADVAETMDARKLSSLIFRPGFTTKRASGARGLGMDTVRDLVSRANGRVGVATKAQEYTRFRIVLPRSRSSAAA